ncbi:efflux RND transporter periplasmic adaptor subunit [Hymenobacter terricola]|uniref:efflux RND transporter periplasmic adaptor subunit n=1 Tax=Hymenobacter terricola TaxID=2819236 RepID=UPI001B310259|nr:efflux RND transporter periplasmic adaptor subunit [Hymenobacter terricola]
MKIHLNLLLLLAGLYGCSGAASSLPAAAPAALQALPVLELRAGSATTYQDYPAAIEGVVNVEIRPQVSGTLDRVFVEEGAFVHTGDPLFKINDAPYRERLNNARAALHAAQAAFTNAGLEVTKLTPLVQNKVIAPFQLQTAQAARQGAAATIEQARAEVASAQINVGYTLLRAPVSGYLGRLMRKQGSLVTPGDAESLTQLSDVHEVHVYFALGETDFIRFKAENAGTTLADKIKRLPPVELILPNDSTYALKGRIDLLDGQFDKNTGAITVRASFRNPDGLLRAGSTGKVRLGLAIASAVTVPQAATLEMQDKLFVFLVGDSNKVSKQPIVVAGGSGANYLVQEGLKAGNRIVYSGFDRLHEGEAIQPEKMKDAPTQLVKN